MFHMVHAGIVVGAVAGIYVPPYYRNVLTLLSFKIY